MHDVDALGADHRRETRRVAPDRPAGSSWPAAAATLCPPARSTARTSRPPALATSARPPARDHRLGRSRRVPRSTPPPPRRRQHLQHRDARHASWAECIGRAISRAGATGRTPGHAGEDRPARPRRRREHWPGRCCAGRGPTWCSSPASASDMTRRPRRRRWHAFCAARGQAMLRFDYSGHGASGGRVRRRHDRALAADALAVDRPADRGAAAAGRLVDGRLDRAAGGARPARRAWRRWSASPRRRISPRR